MVENLCNQEAKRRIGAAPPKETQTPALEAHKRSASHKLGFSKPEDSSPCL